MGYGERIANFWDQCKRVLRVTKKPDKEEYKVITKVAAIGILIIGGIGFMLRMAEESFSMIIAASIVFIAVLLLLYWKVE